MTDQTRQDHVENSAKSADIHTCNVGQTTQATPYDQDTETQGTAGEVQNTVESGHHHKCNYWKWDRRYSWDKTDCSCAEQGQS